MTLNSRWCAVDKILTYSFSYPRTTSFTKSADICIRQPRNKYWGRGANRGLGAMANGAWGFASIIQGVNDPLASPIAPHRYLTVYRYIHETTDSYILVLIKGRRQCDRCNYFCEPFLCHFQYRRLAEAEVEHMKLVLGTDINNTADGRPQRQWQTRCYRDVTASLPLATHRDSNDDVKILTVVLRVGRYENNNNWKTHRGILNL